jgi:hypothetical protein
MIHFDITKNTDVRLRERMQIHYSQPRGFVGRNICYAVYWGAVYYGHVVAGSATRFLPGRNEFLGISLPDLNHVINNIFYNVSKVNGQYPCRNFTSRVIEEFMVIAIADWEIKYGDFVVGFEILIEKPRTGDLYRRAGWQEVGETKGYTCKRTGGNGTDSWGGKRVWNTEVLRPKLVLCKRRFD